MHLLLVLFFCLQVWAFAKLGYYNPELFKAAAWRGVETIHAFTPQSLANFLWAYATLNIAPDPAFLRVALSHALKTLDQWAPQNLSNVAWALANLKKDHESAVESALNVLLPAVVAEVTRRLMDPEKEKDFSRQVGVGRRLHVVVCLSSTPCASFFELDISCDLL